MSLKDNIAASGGKLRNAAMACNFLVIMKPSGRLYMCEYAQNRRGGAVEVRDGQPRLRDKYRDRGYKLLDEIADSDEQREFWPAYFEAGRKLKGRIGKLDEATLAKMVPKAAKKAEQEAKTQQLFDLDAFKAAVKSGEDPIEAAKATKASPTPESKPKGDGKGAK